MQHNASLDNDGLILTEVDYRRGSCLQRPHDHSPSFGGMRTQKRVARQSRCRHAQCGPIHDCSLVLALAQDHEWDGDVPDPGTVATAAERTVHAVAGVIREKPQHKTRCRRRASSTQCRRANPRAARGGDDWLEKQPAYLAQQVAGA